MSFSRWEFRKLFNELLLEAVRAIPDEVVVVEESDVANFVQDKTPSTSST